MIELFRWNGKWRIKIVNETLEFESKENMQYELALLIELKEGYEPYKKND